MNHLKNFGYPGFIEFKGIVRTDQYSLSGVIPGNLDAY